MKILIMADVHGNLEALEAVLEKNRDSCQEIWCLGDLTGYGPDPNACVEILRDYRAIPVLGNHDWAAATGKGWDLFSPVARTMIKWTTGQLLEEHRSWLASLPEMTFRYGYTLVHGSPAGPIWRYILDGHSAAEAFSLMDTSAGFCGHTHIPMIHYIDRKAVRNQLPRYGKRIKPPGLMWLANPGSCGIPRDGDSRASYIILDSETGRIEFNRLSYPVDRTVAKLRSCAAPDSLIQLLLSGG